VTRSADTYPAVEVAPRGVRSATKRRTRSSRASSDAAKLVLAGLDEAPSGHLHAVWVMDESGPTLAGELVGDRVWLADVDGGDVVAVTLEPAPVSPSPRGNVVAQVEAGT